MYELNRLRYSAMVQKQNSRIQLLVPYFELLALVKLVPLHSFACNWQDGNTPSYYSAIIHAIMKA